MKIIQVVTIKNLKFCSLIYQNLVFVVSNINGFKDVTIRQLERVASALFCMQVTIVLNFLDFFFLKFYSSGFKTFQASKKGGCCKKFLYLALRICIQYLNPKYDEGVA